MHITSPLIMGILNITPDSFFDGNKYTNEKSVLKRIEQMLTEGADIIDIGAFSSRPGAHFVDEKEERKRLMPFLESIIKEYPKTVISIDTYRHNIAQEAIEKGAKMINDISAGELDPKMFETIARLKVPYIMMHMKGTPVNMQNNPKYEDVVNEILVYFLKKMEKLKLLGVEDVIIDPGFGFGKTLDHNYEILHRLDELKILKKPVLVGISRKSMLYKLFNSTPQEMKNATTVTNTIALMKGASILRVHDVKEAVELKRIYQKLLQ
jgi:dihydropteroate synthase